MFAGRLSRFIANASNSPACGPASAGWPRSQRNHIALAVRAWTRLEQAAYHTQQTVYQLKKGFLDKYMQLELTKPSLAFA